MLKLLVISTICWMLLDKHTTISWFWKFCIVYIILNLI